MVRQNRVRRAGAVLAAGGLVVSLCVIAAPAQAQSGDPTVLIDTGHTIGPVSAALTGVNNDVPYENVQGLWDPVASAPYPDALAKIRQSQVGMIRFPGGTPNNEFDWKRSIGPVDQRPCQPDGKEDGGNGPHTEVAYGLDEYMKFLHLTGARAEIMVPNANTSTADAADLVEYLNAPVGTNPNGGTAWAKVRAANGHPAPYGVTDFEIGNEPDRAAQLNWRQGYAGAPMDPAEQVRLYTLGGTKRQTDSTLVTDCDRRASASVATGEAGFARTVKYPPVASDSQVIMVDGTPWREVADLATAGPDDHVYAFDDRTGTATFGDGTHGAIPAAGAKLTADYTPANKPGYLDFRTAMKRVDPRIHVCSTWAPIQPSSGQGTAEFAPYLASIGHANDWDCLVAHPYTSFGAQGLGDWTDPRDGHDAYMVGEQTATAMMDRLDALIRQYGTGKQYLATSEYGALWFSGSGDHNYPNWNTSMSHVLYMASQWTRFAQLGLPWAMGNTLIPASGLRALLGSAPQFVYTGDAVAREQFGPLVHGGGRTVATTISANPQVATDREITGITHYDALTATAAVGADGRMRIAVVNRDPEQAVRANVLPVGYHSGPTASWTTVAGDDITSYNGPDVTGVTIQHGSGAWHPGAVPTTFPAHSITVITLGP